MVVVCSPWFSGQMLAKKPRSAIFCERESNQGGVQHLNVFSTPRTTFFLLTLSEHHQQRSEHHSRARTSGKSSKALIENRTILEGISSLKSVSGSLPFHTE